MTAGRQLAAGERTRHTMAPETLAVAVNAMSSEDILTTTDPELLRLAVFDRDCSLASALWGAGSSAYDVALSRWAAQLERINGAQQ